jgi:hypothetical protein
MDKNLNEGMVVARQGDVLQDMLSVDSIKRSGDALIKGMVETRDPVLIKLAMLSAPLVSEYQCTPLPKNDGGNDQEKCENANELDDGYVYLFNKQINEHLKTCHGTKDCRCCRSKMRYADLNEKCGPGVWCRDGG